MASVVDTLLKRLATEHPRLLNEAKRLERSMNKPAMWMKPDEKRAPEPKAAVVHTESHEVGSW